MERRGVFKGRARALPGARSGLFRIRVLGLLLELPLFGAFAFMAVEGWSFFDSLYMSVITLTTVGFQEVHPLTAGGRVVVIVYLVLGLGVFLLGVSYVGEVVLRVQLREFLEKKKMDSAISSLSGHIVICGLGRMGVTLAESLARHERDFVVVERDEEVLQQVGDRGWLTVCGDCTEDRVLADAGINEASGLAAVLSSDADNLFVVLSARLLNPKLQIMSRAADHKSVEKLERAGANRVVNLYETGASKMARLLLHPNVEDFMQLLTSTGAKMDLAEIVVESSASFCGQTLAETDFREAGIIIVGYQKPGEEFIMPPPSSVRLVEGDTLIAFGKAAAINDLIQHSG